MSNSYADRLINQFSEDRHIFAEGVIRCMDGEFNHVFVNEQNYKDIARVLKDANIKYPELQELFNMDNSLLHKLLDELDKHRCLYFDVIQYSDEIDEFYGYECVRIFNDSLAKSNILRNSFNERFKFHRRPLNQVFKDIRKFRYYSKLDKVEDILLAFDDDQVAEIIEKNLLVENDLMKFVVRDETKLRYGIIKSRAKSARSICT